MRIDSSGQVGIGTTSPASLLHISSSSNTRIKITAGTSNDSQINFGDSGDDDIGMINYDHASNSMKFVTNTAERMRINSDGEVFINTATGFDVGRLCIDYPSTNRGIALKVNTTSASDQIAFTNPNGIVGTITSSASATAYNTSSDYRLKENVNYNFDATTRLKQLKPARFNFIVEPNKTVDGFLAHEVQDIIPEAITGEKDKTETKEKVVVNADGRVIAQNIEQADWETGKIPNEEGTLNYPIDSTWEASKVLPVYQGIDQAKLTPLLTKALQEAIAKIESLEARLTALES
jgi:hypothetical protein